jgi:DNA-binding response OmpR family regulator
VLFVENILKILVVEDDINVSSFIEKGLKEENYTVKVLFDGLAGLNASKSERFDLIILDIMLPEIDGITLCSCLRANGIKTPVIILTARDSVDDKISGFSAGADDYLTKPFSFDELTARIRALIRRSREYSFSEISYCDLVIDPSSRIVKRGDRIIKLSSKEYALLEFMVNNRERLITEEEIIRNIWNSETDLFTNIVNVYMHHLRSKIDKGSEKKLIHTVRGAGYIFEER